MSKLLTVFGATGQQGGSILHYLLRRPDVLNIYRLRGITRDVSKPAAVALKEAGVEMVQADMDDKASLRAAVAGSNAVFAMTNFWETGSAEVEVAQGKAMADAAVGAGAELIVWASLPNVTEMSGGKLSNVKNYDDKAEVEAYIRTLPIKSAFFMPAMYMQMFTHMFKPKPNNDRELVFSVTWSGRCPLIDIRDAGKFIVPALLDPDKYNGKRFTAATAFYTPAQMVEGWKKVTGKEIQLGEASDGAWGQGFPPGLLAMLKEVTGLISEYECYGPTGQEDLDWTLAQMDDAATTWERFVQDNEPWFD
ncbi:MAG: hypothetical protein LQ349_005346 [Xanthoria aureola]|nr:MAG: hypothetical protein LQ349_005346 [Xanthoria aureola]